MQWLIDIVKQWVIDQFYATEAWVTGKNYLTHAFVDRGDANAWDYEDADFTTDGTWHEMDLSGIIPTGTKGVAIFIKARDNLIGSWFQLKTRGNINNINISSLETQIANLYVSHDWTLAPSSARKIQYRAANTTFTNIRLCVTGWWL